MDYSRLMIGVQAVGGESGGSDNPSVEPTTQIISDYFAEPNLPQQYTESLGAPFGERYVYTIFMQGINVLPDIPSSADGSELTARIKEYEDGVFFITEYYYVKEEGEWVADGDLRTISEWTEETESSGGGGNVFLGEDSEGYLTYEERKVSYTEIQSIVMSGVIPWLVLSSTYDRYMPLESLGATDRVFTVGFLAGSDGAFYVAQSADESLRIVDSDESEEHTVQ